MISYPIMGPLRIRLLIMEIILLFACFELGGILLARYLKSEKLMRNSEELGYSLLFLGFFVMNFFFLISDYYSSEDLISPFLIWREGSIRYLFLNIGYFSLLIAAIIFLYCCEKNKIYFYKKYAFTIIFIMLGIIFTILFIVDIRLSQEVTYILWGVYLIFLLVYLMDFIKKVQKNRQKLFIGIIKYFPGIFFWLFGFSLTTTLFAELFGHEIRLLGIIFEIIGIFLLFIFFITLPPFAEFDWHDSIEEILVMNNAGLVIFEKKLRNTLDKQDGVLVGGALKHVKILLENISKSESRGYSTFEKKGKTIIIFQSKDLTGVIFSTKNLRILHLLLKKFILRVEAIYANLIPEWNGDLIIFEPIDIIYNIVFKVEK